MTGRIANEKSHPGYGRLLAANFIGLFIVYAFGMVYYYVISNFVLKHADRSVAAVFILLFCWQFRGISRCAFWAAAIGKRMIPMIRGRGDLDKR